MCRASVEEVCGHDGGEVWVERHGDAAGVHVDAAALVLVFIVAGLFVDDDVGEAEHVEEAFEVGGVCVEVDARVLDAMLDLRASCMSNANGFLRIWLGSKWPLTQNSGWRVVSHQR